MQASIRDLYDPDRSHAVSQNGDISTWALFLADLNELLREHSANKGAGLRFLTETVTSPPLAAQLRQILQKFPEAKWHQYEPVNLDNAHEGSRLAFGEVVAAQHRFDRAAIILSLESDFMYSHPMRLRYARDFKKGRQVSAGSNAMNRLYVAESTPTVTGSMADNRLLTRSDEIENVARLIAQQLGAPPQPIAQPASEAQAKWIAAIARELQNHRGGSVVIAGEQQPPMVHALAHLMNDTLSNVGSTVSYTESAEANPENQLESLRGLAKDMKAGAVETLIILGGNPVYNAPADLEFAESLLRVKRSIHLAQHLDETSALCLWHIPEAHFMESWGAARAYDGTVSMIQPLIAPLYGGKSAHEVLGAMIQQQPIPSDHDVVRSYWRNQNIWPEFEKGWRRALHDGLIAGTVLPPRQVQLKLQNFQVVPEVTGRKREPAANVEVLFRPDPNIWDGRFANNGWLQEVPKPLNKLCWDNAARISPALAEKLSLSTGDVVELNLQGRALRAPVWVMPGQAEQTVTLMLGYGRTRAGLAGDGVGFNAYALRTSAALWSAPDLKITPAGQRHKLATTQNQHVIPDEERQVYRGGTMAEFLANPHFAREKSEHPPKEETLYDPDEFVYNGYRWGMSIDLTACIGCNACVLGCEAENNIPVVGKDQIARGRDMLWIRIDTYHKGSVDNPGFAHMPVPCMH
jgi:molybdopterin-containing oxidoreductase family iron-sulfur binding subunit